jgi:nitroreductase
LPSRSNRQGWQWVVVTESEKKRRIGELYRESWYAYSSSGRPSYPEGDPRRLQQPRVISSAQYLADRMGDVPAMVIPCHEGRVDVPGASNLAIAGVYGSILPAAWSFMLAARGRGLGTTWTTLHLKYEREIADLLGTGIDRPLGRLARSLKSKRGPRDSREGPFELRRILSQASW